MDHIVTLPIRNIHMHECRQTSTTTYINAKIAQPLCLNDDDAFQTAMAWNTRQNAMCRQLKCFAVKQKLSFRYIVRSTFLSNITTDSQQPVAKFSKFSFSPNK